MRLYPKGTGAGISLFILIVLGIYTVSQVESMKRAAFREGFSCAKNENTQSLHSPYQCKEYRDELSVKN